MDSPAPIPEYAVRCAEETRKKHPAAPALTSKASICSSHVHCAAQHACKQQHASSCNQHWPTVTECIGVPYPTKHTPKGHPKPQDNKLSATSCHATRLPADAANPTCAQNDSWPYSSALATSGANSAEGWCADGTSSRRFPHIGDHVAHQNLQGYAALLSLTHTPQNRRGSSLCHGVGNHDVTARLPPDKMKEWCAAPQIGSFSSRDARTHADRGYQHTDTRKIETDRERKGTHAPTDQ
jgi:hypothetical protein